MSTIPASAIVQIIPGTISAGGAGLVLNGLQLTQSWRVPINTVQPFASSAAVGAFFGLASQEYAQAVVYFDSYENATQLPGSMLVAQYPQTAVAAWLRSGPVNVMTVAQIAAITGTLTVTTDGYSHVVSSLSLSGGTSYTALALLLQTALNTTEPTEASVTGGIAAETATLTGSISNDILTVTNVASGTPVPGAVISGGTIKSGTQIVQQMTGATGGIGTYAVSIAQEVVSTTITVTYGLFTVATVVSGTVSIGQTVSGAATGTVVTALGSGLGLTGTYYVNLTQTVVNPTALTLTATPVVVSYDAQSGSFVITSGITGSPSSVIFATGTAAPLLNLTQATGAILSQGSPALTPAAFMLGVTLITQNWASFWLNFDADDGQGNANKLAFAAWTSAQLSRYIFMCWDTDITPTATVPATTSLGYLLSTSEDNYGGTALFYDPNLEGLAAFAAGYVASLNFQATNGRTTLAFRTQLGLAATVSNQQIAANLLANGYNFYGAYATANQNWLFMYNGSISGPFAWLDSFANQIWMNNQFQLDLINMLTALNSVPYNQQGYTQIQNALTGTIQQALNFGAIRAGIPLSSVQIETVNQDAGLPIDQVLSTTGWYIQVQPATPQVRQLRQSPVIFVFYCDGQSIQQITLSSLELL